MSDILAECFGDAILGYLQTTTSKSPTPCDFNTDRNAGSLVPSMAGLKLLFHHHLLQLRCNSHFISVVMLENPQEPSLIATASSDHSTSAIETTSEKKLGTAIYPTASLMNHACAPNVFFRYNRQ